MGQPFIVENRAGGVILDVVSKAAPDGHTLLYYGSNIWLMPFLRPTVPFEAGAAQLRLGCDRRCMGKCAIELPDVSDSGWTQVLDKLKALTQSVLSVTAREEIVERVSRLEEQRNLRELIALTKIDASP